MGYRYDPKLNRFVPDDGTTVEAPTESYGFNPASGRVEEGYRSGLDYDPEFAKQVEEEEKKKQQEQQQQPQPTKKEGFFHEAWD